MIVIKDDWIELDIVRALALLLAQLPPIFFVLYWNHVCGGIVVAVVVAWQSLSLSPRLYCFVAATLLLYWGSMFLWYSVKYAIVDREDGGDSSLFHSFHCSLHLCKHSS